MYEFQLIRTENYDFNALYVIKLFGKRNRFLIDRKNVTRPTKSLILINL